MLIVALATVGLQESHFSLVGVVSVVTPGVMVEQPVTAPFRPRDGLEWYAAGRVAARIRGDPAVGRLYKT